MKKNFARVDEIQIGIDNETGNWPVRPTTKYTLVNFLKENILVNLYFAGFIFHITVLPPRFPV